MRIIAGTAGRLAIKVPSMVTRPTTDFVRQAVFSILGERIENADVLDLFAGSGALGLEALSRGASSCTFVENHRQAAKVISENLAKAKLGGGRVVCSDVGPFLSRDTGRYDLIFADPPYYKHFGDRHHVAELLEGDGLRPRLVENGWFVAEISSSQSSPQSPGWTLADRREYGGSAILLYAPEGGS
jgi:16S rRNA (guanine966-N2)-methyltransferase